MFSQTVCGQNYAQENMEQAKTRLGTLYKQWQWLDRDYFETLDAELLKRVDKSPKGEFETTKQFEDRTAKAEKIEEQIREEVLKKNGLKREMLDQQMNRIMTMEFDSPFTALIGTYNADTQKFPLSFASGSEEFLSVPLSEAKEFKEKVAQAKAFGKFALLLDSDGRAKEYLLSGKITLNSKSYQITPKNMDVERAMFLLFGNLETAKKRSVWHYVYGSIQDKEYYDADNPDVQSVMPSKFDSEKIYIFSNDKMYAVPVFSKTFQENGLSKFLIVAGSRKDSEADYEAKNMSMARFVQKNGVWKLESLNRNLDYRDTWERLEKTSLIKIGKDKYAILFEGYQSGAGIEINTSYYISWIDGVIKEIFRVSNLDVVAGYVVEEYSRTLEAKVEYLPVTDSDYYNIKVTTTGSKAVKVGKRLVMKPFNEVVIYKFVDGSYQPVVPSKQSVSTKTNLRLLIAKMRVENISRRASFFILTPQAKGEYLMNSADFKVHIQESINSLPPSVKDVNLSTDERKLEALIHLNTSIYPHLKNDMQELLEISQMKNRPEKLRAAMIWNIAVSQTPPKI